MDVSKQYRFQRLFHANETHLTSFPTSLDRYCRTDDFGQSVYFREQDRRHKQPWPCRHRSGCLCAQGACRHLVEAKKRRFINCSHCYLVFTPPSESRVLFRYNTVWLIRTLFYCTYQQIVICFMRGPHHHGTTPGLMANWAPFFNGLVAVSGITNHEGRSLTGGFLLPSRVIKSLYRGLIQSVIGRTSMFRARTLRDRRDTRHKVLWLTMLDLIYQLLKHIPVQWLWPACHVENLGSEAAATGSDHNESMLLTCCQSGGALKLRYLHFGRWRPK